MIKFNVVISCVGTGEFTVIANTEEEAIEVANKRMRLLIEDGKVDLHTDLEECHKVK